MKRTSKKVLALLLTLTMLIGFFPANPAMAEDTPFTPGSGGPMPSMDALTSPPDTFAGLFVACNEIVNSNGAYDSEVQINAPSPASVGADSFVLQYSSDGGTSWNIYHYKEIETGLIFETTDPSSSTWFIISPLGSYEFRLLAAGGAFDGKCSNIVDVQLPGVHSYFPSWGLNENMSNTGIMASNVGYGLKAYGVINSSESGDVLASAVLNAGETDVTVTGPINFQWYRVNPLTFEKEAISDAVSASYTTTNDDLGYKIMCEISGDGNTTGGYVHVMGSASVVFPNEAYASNIDDTGFTLNLKYSAPGGLAVDKFTLSSGASPIAISSVTEIGDGASDNAVFRISADLSGVSSGSYLNLSNTSGAWKISSEMGPMHDLMQGLNIEMPYRPMPNTAAFTGDTDHIYFAGDTLNFSLTGLPAALSEPARVAFGVVDPNGTFTPADVISGLTPSDSGVQYFTTADVYGGSLTAPINGIVQSGLSTGIIAVKLYISMGPNVWVDALTYAGVSPAYLPLASDDKPAMVGFDNVLPDGITTEPALSAITDFYSPSLNIKFIKALGNGDTGSISFAGIDLADRTAMEQLTSLGTALLIREDTPAAGSGIDRQFTFSVDDTALSALADVGATISVTSSSFDGLSAYNFNLGVCEVGGPAYLVRSFDPLTNTVSFAVPHFSGYMLTLDDSISAVSFTNSKTDVTAFGGSDGSITLTPSGGSGTYEYSLDNGDTWTAANSPYEITGLSAGTYQVMVRDEADNTNVSSAAAISVSTPGAVSFTYVKTNETAPENNNGSITLTPSGGGGTYEYSLNNGGTWAAISSPYAIAGLSAAAYQVKIRDATDTANISEASTVITILEPIAPAAPSVTCNDDANTVSGMAEGMEYKLDGTDFTAYDAGIFKSLNFSGAHTLLVRVASDGYNPAGAVMTLTFTVNPPPAPVLENNYLIGAGSNADAAADGSGNVYAVFESNGNTYFAKNRETPEAIPGGGSDSIPSIAVRPDGTAHVVFVRGSEVTYAKRAPSGGWTITDIAVGNTPDIDIDANGYAHIVFMNTDSYADVIYAENTSGSFVMTTIWDGIWDYWQGSGTGRYFWSPSIKVDGNGNFHIAAVHHAYDKGMGWQDHNYYIVYATDSNGANISSASFGNNGSVAENRRSLAIQGGVPTIAYEVSGNIYTSPNTVLVAGGAPASAAFGVRRGIAFNSSGVKYILDTGTGFSAAANIDAAGTNPAVAVDGTDSYVYYEKGGNIYLSTDKNVAPPIVLSITDNDLDNVYFGGDTLSFNIAGLNSLDGQNMRVAFGTVDEMGGFTPASVISGLTENADSVEYFKDAAVVGGVLSADISGLIQSGLNKGEIGLEVFYESPQGTWVNAFAVCPQPFVLLTDGTHPAYVGFSLPSGISSAPELGSGAQDTENLYNINIAFEKTIAAGITGTIAFTGLDLISCGSQLDSLSSAVTMDKAANPGAGKLEKYTIGIDTGSLSYLDGISAAISVHSASFNGKTTADFTAESVDVTGGTVSGLSFDYATDTVSFNVNHFSNYSLSLTDPSDANGDGYYDPDVAAIRAFLEQPSAVLGKKNGEIVLDSGYDGNNPSTYVGQAFFTWDSGSPKRLTGIHWDSSWGYHSPDLAGSFNASSLSELTSLIIEDTDNNTNDDIAEGLTAITVSGLSKLKTLQLTGNSLSSLDISGCSELTELKCQENLLTSVNLVGAANLTFLNVGYNKLSTLSISALVKLQTLWCYGNEISVLDLSPLTELTSLDCQSNELTVLDVGSNPRLTSIYCEKNNLGTLDVSGKNQLEELDCNDCNLTSLNLAGCTALRNIYCSDNNLVELNLTAMTALQNLYCDGNRLSLSALPVFSPAPGNDYIYAPQQVVHFTLTAGNAVDLSGEKTFDSNATIFKWYKASDNSEITAGITESPTGVFTFDRATYAGTDVYCRMTNASYPDLTAGDALKTVSFTILSLPQCDAPVLTVSGTSVSWSAIDGAAGYKVQLFQKDGTTAYGPEISLAGTVINLALLSGDSVQTLPGGTYKVRVYALGNNTTKLDSDWSAFSGDVVLSLSPFETAAAAVVTAEGAPTQANINAAQALVTALPDGTVKTALQSRINAVQGAVDAADALTVQNMIAALPAAGALLLTDTAVGAARSAYTTLTAAQKLLVTNNAVLTAAEAALTALENATASVGAAEAAPTQANVNTAQALVTALPDGSAKTALLDRLAAVQSLVATTAAVVTAESTSTQANVNTAQALVTALPDGTAKTALQVRLAAVQSLINAAAAVETAETTPTQANVNAAQALVTALPDGAAKTALHGRINAVQATVDAAVATTVQNMIAALPAAGALLLTDTAVGAARSAYNALTAAQKLLVTNYSVLTAAEALLTALGTAAMTVGAAEAALTQANVNTAQALVTALPDGTAKTALQGRIDAVQGAVDAAAALTVQNMIAALPAPGALLLTDTGVGAARSAYSTLTAAQKLLVTNYSALTAAEALLTALENATVSVGAAEAAPTQANVNAAQTLVTALADGAAKTALQLRLATVQSLIAATAAVVTAESAPTQEHIAAAQTLVNALANSEAKAALLARIATVLATSYVVTVSALHDVTVTPQAGSVSPVLIGGSYSFTVTLPDKYNPATLVVKADGKLLSPANGVYTVTDIYANTKITVDASIKTYTLTTTSTGSGTINPSTKTVSYGDSVLLTTLPGTGSEVTAFAVNGTDKTALLVNGVYTVSNITENTTVAAVFTAKNYTVTKTAGTGGSIAANSSVSYGSSLDVTLTPDAGSYVSGVSYSVAGVTKTPSLTSGTGSAKTFSIANVTGNVTIFASFASVDKSALINYIAAAQLINIEPYQDSYKTAFSSALASAVSVKNNANATASEVSTAANALSAAINDLTSDHKITFSVTVSNTANGTAFVDNLTPEYGGTVNITATPNTGYALYKIFVNGVQINGLAAKNIVADTTITVLFKSTVPAAVTSFKLTYTGILSKTVSNTAMSDSTAVDFALTAYGALSSDNQKYLGTEYQLLKQLQTHLFNLAAANTLSAVISGLVNDNSMTFVTAAWNAKAEYDALTPDQQKLLPVSAVNTLTNLINAANAIYLNNVAEQAKLDYVNALVGSLLTSIGVGGYTDVAAATGAYLPAKSNFDSLTAAQQSQIAQSAKLAALKEAINTANRTAASLVSDMITNLTAVTPNTAFNDAEVSKKAIIEAKNAYDALTADQKGLIGTAAKAKLDECFVSVSVVIEKPMPQEVDSTLAGGVTFTGISDTISDLTVGTPGDYASTEATINVAVNGGGDSAMRAALLFDLTPKNAAGVDTQPEGKVKIRILLGAVLAAISDTLSVVYSHDNQIYSVPCTIISEDGKTYLEFETDRFSTYAIISEVLSSNNYLSALSASGISITPAFSRNTFSYTASVANSVTSTTISATAEDVHASVDGTDTIALDVGTKTYNIEVTAQDGSKQTYSITLTRAAAAAADVSSGGANTTKLPEVGTTVRNNTATIAVSVSGTTSAAGSTSGAISSATATSLIDHARSAESSGQKAVVEISVSTASATTSAALSIPRGEFNLIASGTDADVKVNTAIGTVSFNAKAVEAISGASASGNIVIEIAAVNADTLPSQIRETLGDRPVYDFTVTSGSSRISGFGTGSAQISIPYTPKTGEDTNAIIVYYINDNGTLEAIRGAYNSQSGDVVFTTAHFSKYAVGYNKVSFTDVAANAWYSDAVSFISARDISLGTSDGVFSPDASLTRGQFAVLLMRAYGIAPDTNPSDNFSDAGSTYYSGYLAAAKRLGISTGIGDNLFAPENSITRQDMFTLLYRALVVLGEGPAATAAAAESFSDTAHVSPYAITAFDSLLKGGIITGSEGNLNPTGTTTRAQMAQVLYKLLSK